MDFTAKQILNELDSNNAMFIYKVCESYDYQDVKKKAFEEIKKKNPKI